MPDQPASPARRRLRESLRPARRTGDDRAARGGHAPPDRLVVPAHDRRPVRRRPTPSGWYQRGSTRCAAWPSPTAASWPCSCPRPVTTTWPPPVGAGGTGPRARTPATTSVPTARGRAVSATGKPPDGPPGDCSCVVELTRDGDGRDRRRGIDGTLFGAWCPKPSPRRRRRSARRVERAPIVRAKRVGADEAPRQRRGPQVRWRRSAAPCRASTDCPSEASRRRRRRVEGVGPQVCWRRSAAPCRASTDCPSEASRRRRGARQRRGPQVRWRRSAAPCRASTDVSERSESAPKRLPRQRRGPQVRGAAARRRAERAPIVRAKRVGAEEAPHQGAGVATAPGRCRA